MTRRIRNICLPLVVSLSLMSQVHLPKLISDGMVLQRGASVKVWGWASNGERITIRFIGSSYKTVADSLGNWSVNLPKMKAGGPYDLSIMASDTVTIHDILIGDVWVASGQSNMELPVRRVKPFYESDVANSTNKFIRTFNVPQKYDFNAPRSDVDGGNWIEANPKNVLVFSATSYFFAKELYEKYKVPIGLIHTSLGGSPAEAWMSEGALQAFPAYQKEAQRFKDSSLIRSIDAQDKTRMDAWYKLSGEKDLGYHDSSGAWRDPEYVTTDWSTMEIPGYWDKTDLGPVNGVVWFRKDVVVPASMTGREAKIILGRIVDADSVFINGKFVGTTSYQYPPRRYDIPPGVLKEGKNAIVIRVISNIGRGGFVLDKAYELKAGEETIVLRGKWQYKLGAIMDSLASQTFIRWKPTGLYNAMLAPLFNYRIKGAIWYQGEANTSRAAEYRSLLGAMIQNWRSEWGQGNFPFLLVQLPNFMEAKDRPSESNWAALREAQLQTLAVRNTGLAVTIDIGEWNDIHPINKKDVGKRLALAAQKVAYGAKVVHSGPIFQSMKLRGKKATLTFQSIGGGLMAKGGGELRCFAIAGTDKQFVWAHAVIQKNKIIVWNDTIPNPVAVRYAWADNPEGANLCNKEGLPASPFRTDH